VYDRRHIQPEIYYARSADGLWVRAVRTSEAVRLEWQQRTEQAPGGMIRTLDVNGAVVAEGPLHRHRWAPTWALAGSIPLGDTLVAWCGVRNYDACAYGIQRHAAGLLAYGYGDTPEDVADWFADPADLDWAIDGVRYRIDRSFPPLDGLVGSIGVLDASGQHPVLNLRVIDRIYPISLEDSSSQCALLCAALLSPTAVD